jgi:hypothetical protein
MEVPAAVRPAAQVHEAVLLGDGRIGLALPPEIRSR